MTYTTEVAKTAALDITRFLETHWSITVAVHNVEDDPAYQQHDVDLLWTVAEKDRLRVIPVEIKGDRYHQTGNFFFETVSNESRGTPGCFLYTRAEWLFYYFVENGRLFCLPMEKTRAWFAEKWQQFEERRTSTPVKEGEVYVTIGRLVPIDVVLAEVPGVLQFKKTETSWSQMSTPHDA